MHRKPKVLVIEDDAQQARYFQLLLSRHEPSFDVDTVDDGPPALEMLATTTYDIVTIDYHLPSTTGVELLGQLKKRFPHIPAIMVTGQGDELIAVEAMRQGAYDYITKAREYLELLPRILLRAIRESTLAQQLEESRQRYYDLFHNANIAIFVIDAETMHIQQMNQNAGALLGLPSDTVRQKAFFNLVAADQQHVIENLFQNIKQTGKAAAGNIKLLHQDKTIVPVDVSGSFVQSGEHGLVEFFVTDIREKLTMLRQVQISQQRLLALFNGITDLISVLATDYKLLMGNKRYLEFTSNTTKSVATKRCYEALFNKSEPCEICPALKTYDTGESNFVEIHHDDRIYDIWTFPMQTHDGKPEYIVEYIKDVTEDKELEQQLIKSEKMASVGLLSSGIAHELRNPLNIIETARYSIESILPDRDKDIKAKLGVIKANIQRASAIIDNLLQFSRQSNLKKEKIDVSGVIKNTISLLYKEMTRHNIQVFLALADTTSANLNLDSLKQVFLNIIQNAIHAMPNGGEFRVRSSVSDDEKWVNVEFIDSGEGISTENVKHIFTPFFTTKDPNKGTGLGLYLAYTLLKREGGDIEVESVVGQGSTFRIRLPAGELS